VWGRDLPCAGQLLPFSSDLHSPHTRKAFVLRPLSHYHSPPTRRRSGKSRISPTWTKIGFRRPATTGANSPAATPRHPPGTELPSDRALKTGLVTLGSDTQLRLKDHWELGRNPLIPRNRELGYPAGELLRLGEVFRVSWCSTGLSRDRLVSHGRAEIVWQALPRQWRNPPEEDTATAAAWPVLCKIGKSCRLANFQRL